MSKAKSLEEVLKVLKTEIEELITKGDYKIDDYDEYSGEKVTEATIIKDYNLCNIIPFHQISSNSYENKGYTLSLENIDLLAKYQDEELVIFKKYSKMLRMSCGELIEVFDSYLLSLD